MKKALLNLAKETAVSAGHLALEMWKRPLTVSEKGYRDLVTDADIAAQAHITQAILKAYPSHGFVTEEEDDTLPTSGEIIWIIDPIDGTTNYSRHQPQFCVSVAAARPLNGGYEPLVGVIYDPGRDELFWAAQGEGAWMNGRRLGVSNTSALEYAIIGLDLSDSKRLDWSSREIIVELSRKAHGVRLLGSAAIGMAWVAAGRFDAYFNISLKPWDVAASYLIVIEAGGNICNTLGDNIIWDKIDIDCVASNGQINKELIPFIKNRISQ